MNLHAATTHFTVYTLARVAEEFERLVTEAIWISLLKSLVPDGMNVKAENHYKLSPETMNIARHFQHTKDCKANFQWRTI